MPRCLAYTTLLVPSYDEARSWFSEVLRFEVLEDALVAPDKRWLVVAPSREGGALLLARATTPEQQALIGRQGGGRVWLFLHSDAFDADLEQLRRHGVQIDGAVRDESYGRVAVFVDPWGNRWDLIEPKAAPA
jgi:catechol 2,3-dioxygenase-like lactoylglutathione lyase family enzyme